MNPLAEMWARRRLEELQVLELRKLAVELREANDALRPKIEANLAAERARRRQDGPTGFVMVSGRA